MATQPVETEEATNEEIANLAESLIPLAVPDTGDLLDGTEGYGELLPSLSNSLEVFQNTFVNIVTDEGRNDQRSRMFFTTALIPGTNEKIPVFGLRESRKKLKNNHLKLDVFVFNGQERQAAGTIHVTLKPDGQPLNLQVYVVNGHHLVFSAVNTRQGIQVYDSKGQLLLTLSERKRGRKKKGKAFYEARESTLANRLVANIEMDIEKVTRTRKRLKEMTFSFTDISDILVKPQVFFSSFMLVYLNKL